jgi:putative hemolysin
VSRQLALAPSWPACSAPAQPLPRQANWQFETSWASSEAEVREAQRLRYAIFVDEMGARLAPPAGTPDGVDADRFDLHCDHLLVRVKQRGSDAPGQLVGTYRVLGPDAARRAGACYTEGEFDLAPLALLRAGALELGRACVHADWRSGGVILALWSALGHYMVEHGLHTMFGCASIGMADGGQLARRVWRQLRDSSYLVQPEFRIRPLTPLPPCDEEGGAAPGQAGMLREMPPLIKGYLRCGAKVIGPPSFDQGFNTADLPIMMQLAELPARYGKQFLARR